MTITEQIAKNIIKKLLRGEDYRIEVVTLINAEFLQFAIDFFKKIVDAKLKNKNITVDWYKKEFLNPDLPARDIAINSGLNKKTIHNMFNSSTKEIVIDASNEHYDALYEAIKNLVDTEHDLELTLTIKFKGVSVDLNVSESLIVINTLAVKRAELRGGLWSTAGKRVEKPLMQTLYGYIYRRGGNMKKLILAGVIVPLIFSACAPRKSVKRQQAMTVKETEQVESKYTGPKRRIGVVEFENKTAYGQGRLGGAASDILITELVKSGKFIVVERDKMNKIMEEQKFQTQGLVDAQTAVKIGKILGLEAIVVGAVSQFGVKTEGHDYLLKQGKQQTAEVTVDIRLIDVENGQIILAAPGKGIAKKKWGSFLGMGTKGGYDETMEGDALRAAIVQFVDDIMNQLNKKAWSCMIADGYDNEVYLNAGQESGIEIGTKLDCYHQGAEIRDPRSNLVIGHREQYIGVVEVTRYCGEGGDCSVARIIKSGSASAKAKDICRLSK